MPLLLAEEVVVAEDLREQLQQTEPVAEVVELVLLQE
jgi:hypothetical protein